MILTVKDIIDKFSQFEQTDRVLISNNDKSHIIGNGFEISTTQNHEIIIVPTLSLLH